MNHSWNESNLELIAESSIHSSSISLPGIDVREHVSITELSMYLYLFIPKVTHALGLLDPGVPYN